MKAIHSIPAQTSTLIGEQLFAGLSPGDTHLSCAGQPWAQRSTAGVASPVLRQMQRSPPSPCRPCSSACSPGPRWLPLAPGTWPARAHLGVHQQHPLGPPSTSCSPARDSHFPSAGLTLALVQPPLRRRPEVLPCFGGSAGPGGAGVSPALRRPGKGALPAPGLLSALCPFPSSCKPQPKAPSPLPVCSLPLPALPILTSPGHLSICPPRADGHAAPGVLPKGHKEGGRHDLDAGNLYCAQRGGRGSQREGGQDPERLAATCWGRQRDLPQSIHSLSGCPVRRGPAAPQGLSGPPPAPSQGREDWGGEGIRGQGKRARRAKGERHCQLPRRWLGLLSTPQCLVPTSSAVHGWRWPWCLVWGRCRGLWVRV